VEANLEWDKLTVCPKEGERKTPDEEIHAGWKEAEFKGQVASRRGI
jgi:hypothetical protein